MSRLLLLLVLGCQTGGSRSHEDPGDGDGGTQGQAGIFPAGAQWTHDASSDPLDPDSDQIISWLDSQGWGLGRMQIDFSLEVLTANASTPHQAFSTTSDFYSPDCDEVAVPLPDGGALEGEEGYTCTTDGDCHLLVHDPSDQLLYEMWRADIVGEDFQGGCLAVWDTSRVYGPEGRGLQCTSADAAGYPIAPLLVTADEVAAGEVDHALRFILPNTEIRADEFVAPATHATGAASGPAEAPAYGAHLRLRADFPMDSLPNDGARVIARALQRYGMYLADGGSVALTFQSDRSTTAKWADLLEGSHDLEAIQPGDFELLAQGSPIPLTYDCVRVD